MKITITVTEQDIKYGIRNSGSACPIALATSRTFDHAVFVSEWIQIMETEKEPDGLPPYLPEMKLPKHAYEFVKEFDRGEEVGRLMFSLDVPDAVLDIITKP